MKNNYTHADILHHDPLKLSPADDGVHWLMQKSFTYEIGFKGSGNFVKVPRGFVTDFASTPRIVWLVFPRWGKYGKGAIVHDYLYATGLKSRKESDSLFLEIMKNSCVDSVSRWFIYSSVRWFGWLWYKPDGERIERLISDARDSNLDAIQAKECTQKRADTIKVLWLVLFYLVSFFSTGYVIFRFICRLWCFMGFCLK